MLHDISQRDEVGKVLHGLSQVVQGVVQRQSKRLTMRDKAKEKSLAAKEQQVAPQVGVNPAWSSSKV